MSLTEGPVLIAQASALFEVFFFKDGVELGVGEVGCHRAVGLACNGEISYNINSCLCFIYGS